MTSVTPLRVARECRAKEPDFLRQRIDRYYADRRARWPRGEHILVGRAPGPAAVLLQSNDYLGMAAHPWVREAERRAASADHRTMVMAAVFLHGDNFQGRFEASMADFMGADAAILTQSGWEANVGLLQALAEPGLPVYVDMFAHMSLREGVHSARAQEIPFRHNSAECLERLIRRYGPGFVVVDAVYSTSGSVAPLFDLVAVAERHGCALVVDESHSLGTHGGGGAGLVQELGLAERVHFRTASLAKAFAGRAGIIACSARQAEYIKYHSNPAIFSSGLLPAEIQRLDAVRQSISVADARRRRLQVNATYLREGLDALGYNVDASKSQILALEPGEEWRTIALRNALETRGVFGSVFCAPATPKPGSLIRFTVNSELSREQLDHVLAVCDEIRDEVRPEEWASTRRKHRQRAVACASLAV